MSVCNTNGRLVSGVVRRVLHDITRGTTRAVMCLSRRYMWHAAPATSIHRPGQSTISSLKYTSSHTVNPSRYLSSSAALSAAQEIDSFEIILSEWNKRRCQSKLLSVEPVRKFSQLAKSANVEKAAVLVLLCSVDGKPSILFTERSNQLYAHRGEISFPGGKADATDSDLSHTALREADEEIGLSSEKVDVWGEMLPVPGRICKHVDMDMSWECTVADGTTWRSAVKQHLKTEEDVISATKTVTPAFVSSATIDAATSEQEID